MDPVEHSMWPSQLVFQGVIRSPSVAEPQTTAQAFESEAAGNSKAELAQNPKKDAGPVEAMNLSPAKSTAT